MRYPRLREALWVALLPLSFAWWLAAALRRRRYPARRVYRARNEVWSIGNLHSGGSGKTPLVMELARGCADRKPVILSRGYGGSLSAEGARVDLAAADGARLYGDEPWMMARLTGRPVYVGRRRAEMAARIDADHPGSLVLLDDGFQHRGLARNRDLVVINTDRPPGDSFLLPLGDLREPLGALAAASAILLNPGVDRDGPAGWEPVLDRVAPGVPRFVVRRRTDGLWRDGAPLEGPVPAPFGAFCAVAEPGRFAADLAAFGAPAFLETFPDHHAYGETDRQQLGARAIAHRCVALITTEKDAAKLGSRPTLGAPVPVLTLRIRYDLPPEFWYFLGAAVTR